MLWRWWLHNLGSNKALILALGDGDRIIARHASNSHTAIISKCGLGASSGAFEITSTVLGGPGLATVWHAGAAESTFGAEMAKSAAGVAVDQHNLHLLSCSTVWVVGSP